jgi:hypothetical protein
LLEPVALAVAIPEAETWTAAEDEVQFTDPLRSRVLPSEYAPVAVSCWLYPNGQVPLLGVTVTDCKLTC